MVVAVVVMVGCRWFIEFDVLYDDYHDYFSCADKWWWFCMINTDTVLQLTLAQYTILSVRLCLRWMHPNNFVLCSMCIPWILVKFISRFRSHVVCLRGVGLFLAAHFLIRTWHGFFFGRGLFHSAFGTYVEFHLSAPLAFSLSFSLAAVDKFHNRSFLMHYVLVCVCVCEFEFECVCVHFEVHWLVKPIHCTKNIVTITNVNVSLSFSFSAVFAWVRFYRDNSLASQMAAQREYISLRSTHIAQWHTDTHI